MEREAAPHRWLLAPPQGVRVAHCSKDSWRGVYIVGKGPHLIPSPIRNPALDKDGISNCDRVLLTLLSWH